MLKQPSKFFQIFITTVIVEFSLILSGIWMMDDFQQIIFGRWPISEWLINYEGGFVRRGLIGQILYQLFPEQALVPKLYQLTFYLYFIYCSVFLLLYRFSKINRLPMLILMLLIPGGIFQMAISSSFYTRKEILFLIQFGILLLIYLQINRTQFNLQKLWVLVFISIAMIGGIILTLSHEAYLFMSFPYVITLFWLLKNDLNENFWVKWCYVATLILIPTTFLMCSIWHGTTLISENIWDSLSLEDRLIIAPHAPYNVYAAIGGIGWSKLQNISSLYGVFISGGWFIWICFSIAQYLVLGYFLSMGFLGQEKDQISIKLSLISIPLICSLSMFFIGSDWGRWIASSSNHVMLFSFYLFSKNFNLNLIKTKFKIWPSRVFTSTRFIHSTLIFWTVIIYELIFKMPECCVQYPFIFIQYSSFMKILTELN